MISFACRSFNLNELVKCSFGLTKGEFRALMLLINAGRELIVTKMGMERSTAQKAISGLMAKGLASRRQVNQAAGGYFYLYKAIDKPILKEKMESIIDKWQSGVKQEIRGW